MFKRNIFNFKMPSYPREKIKILKCLREIYLIPKCLYIFLVRNIL